jgi:3-methyladenine DNA glycosylase Mpg
VLGESGIFILKPAPRIQPPIAQSVRIGIRNGRDLRWRYYLKGNEWVSRRDVR